MGFSLPVTSGLVRTGEERAQLVRRTYSLVFVSVLVTVVGATYAMSNQYILDQILQHRWLSMAAVFALLFAVLGIYIVAKIHVHPPGAMAAWLIGGYFRMLLFSLPYIAMCAWLSGSIDSPFGSLVLSLTIAYVWPLFVGIGSAQNQAFGYLGYITPWSYKWWLFSERPWLVAVGALVMLAFTALLVWFGLSRFKKRDL